MRNERLISCKGAIQSVYSYNCKTNWGNASEKIK